MESYKHYEKVLSKFLNYSVDDVFRRFSTIPNSIKQGSNDKRFLYILGERLNKVILIAHADTVWDKMGQLEIMVKDGIFSSKSAKTGIGADDRAGCAMLWELRKLGHSILVTNGEEKELLGSKWLIANPQNKAIVDEINHNHLFAIQFDRRNANEFKCYNVGTDKFRNYCKAMTGYRKLNRKSETDICVICKDICGVNLSVGFHNEHTPQETLVVAEWMKTLQICERWLSKGKLPKHPLHKAK